MTPLTLGAVQVTRVVESETPTSPRFLFEGMRPAHLEPLRGWLAPHFYDPAADRLQMSIHAFVVRTPRHTVLVDTCVGNDKPRGNEHWHMRSGPFLERLAAAGVAPEAVDLVLCTHLHVDHVGWNTRLDGGRWVPTFPNARYLFARAEFEHWRAEAEREPDGEQARVLADSVQPVLDSGQATLVTPDHAPDPHLWLEPTPGHTPGHCSVHLADGAAEAVITGDMMHHPLQIGLPDRCSRFCVDPQQARDTRRAFLQRYADRDVAILGTHFAAPTAGRIERGHNGWRFTV